MERLNGEIRDREKVFADLKNLDPIIDGMRVYYNFIKKHSALNNRAPVQTPLVGVDVNNK